MFTGLVEETGVLTALRRRRRGATLEIRAPRLGRSLHTGDSIAVNGCCLTVTRRRGDRFTSDLSSETLRRTSFGRLKAGARVNLERPVRLSDRLGGHLVQGHVDGQGTVLSATRNGNGLRVTVGFPKTLRRHLIPKGSVAVDGVSMTVNSLKPDRFGLFVIPETLRRTHFSRLRRGDRVNLEVDFIAKYIESFLKGK